MTLYSDFFAVTEEERRQLDVAVGPDFLCPAVLGQGVDGAKIEYLRSIIRGSLEYDRADRERCRLAWLNWNDYPCFFPIHKNMRDDLAYASHPSIGEWAQTWASVKGWEEAGMGPNDVLEMLMRLSRLAYWAGHTGRHVYVWMCEDLPGPAARDSVLAS